MFGLSAGHLLVLTLVVLLFGAKRLPELGASLGKTVRAFKAATDSTILELDSHSEPASSAEKKEGAQATGSRTA